MGNELSPMHNSIPVYPIILKKIASIQEELEKGMGNVSSLPIPIKRSTLHIL